MITLYDIGPIVYDGKETGSSPFVRRIMYILNYKKLPYEIKLLRYEDVEPTAKSVSAPPTGVRADGTTPRYTVPFLTDSTKNKVVSDSHAIAEYLDAAYPDTPQIDVEGTKVFADKVLEKSRPLLPIVGAKLRERNLMSPVLLEGQRKVYGDAVVSFVYPPEQEAGVWKSTKEAFHELLREQSEEGELTYGDFALAGIFWMMRITFGKESKEWKEISEEWAAGRIGRVFDVIKEHESMQV